MFGARCTVSNSNGWMDGWLGFYDGILTCKQQLYNACIKETICLKMNIMEEIYKMRSCKLIENLTNDIMV